MDNWSAFLGEFRSTLDEAEVRLAELSDDRAGRPAVAGKWSAKQVLGHLVDSAANNHPRFVRAQLEDDLVFDDYAQEDWVRLQGYEKEEWGQLCRLFLAYNRHLLHAVAQIPEEPRRRARERHSMHRMLPEAEPATLEFLIRDYLGHLRHHLAQIFPER